MSWIHVALLLFPTPAGIVAERRGRHGQFSLNLNAIRCLFAVLSPSCAACHFLHIRVLIFFPTLYVYMLIAGFDHAQWLWVCNMQRLAASFMPSLKRSLSCTSIGFALKWPFSKVFGWSLEERCTDWFGIIFFLGIGQWKRRTYLFIKFSLSNEFTPRSVQLRLNGFECSI